MQLDFNYLFKEALKDWPEELDLQVLQYTKPDLQRYTVKNLGQLSDEIESKYVGHKEEILWRDLQISIYSVIHAAAKNILSLNKSSIRAQAVQLVFERRLKEAVAAKAEEWRSEDYVLAEEYFKQNA